MSRADISDEFCAAVLSLIRKQDEKTAVKMCIGRKASFYSLHQAAKRPPVLDLFMFFQSAMYTISCSAHFQNLGNKIWEMNFTYASPEIHYWLAKDHGKLFVEELIEECPGRYCGRTIDQATGKISQCGACPRGSRSNGTFCNKCTHTLQMYDWSYLGFTFLTVLVLHWFFVDYFSKRSRQVIIILFACGAVETFCAAFFTLLLNEPKGTLSLTSCSSEELSDWYTVFYNPKPDYVNTIYCTNEAVYPLYTIVLTFYAISVAMLVVIRPLISHYLCAGQGLSSIYASMYFLPILTAIHAIFGGILYYTYPYIILVSSILSTATVLAKNHITGFRQLFGSKRLIAVMVGHWLLLGYGLLALTQVSKPAIHGPMFVLVITPVIFYLATSSLTDPSKFKR